MALVLALHRSDALIERIESACTMDARLGGSHDLRRCHDLSDLVETVRGARPFSRPIAFVDPAFGGDTVIGALSALVGCPSEPALVLLVPGLTTQSTDLLRIRSALPAAELYLEPEFTPAEIRKHLLGATHLAFLRRIGDQVSETLGSEASEIVETLLLGTRGFRLRSVPGPFHRVRDVTGWLGRSDSWTRRLFADLGLNTPKDALTAAQGSNLARLLMPGTRTVEAVARILYLGDTRSARRLSNRVFGRPPSELVIPAKVDLTEHEAGLRARALAGFVREV